MILRITFKLYLPQGHDFEESFDSVNDDLDESLDLIQHDFKEEENKFMYLDTLYSMAHEFTTVLCILYVVKDTNYKINDWIYRNMYLAVSRARVIADIILICQDFNFDAEQFKDKFDVKRDIDTPKSA